MRGVVLLILLLVSAGAQASEWGQADFRLRSWGLAEGLPGHHVSAVAQDQDGFLWLATMAGLVRFDGTEFRVYGERDGNLPASRFNALDAGPSGRLWIGTEQGQLIVREHGRFRVVAPPYYPNVPIGSIAEAADGSVWFTQGGQSAGADEATLFHWTGDNAAPRKDIEAQLQRYPLARQYTAPDKPGGPMTLEYRFPQMVVGRDADGDVWARAWSGSSLRLRDGLNDPFGAGDSTVLMLGSARVMARAAGEGIDLLSLADGGRIATLPRNPDRLYGVWLRDRRDLLWVTGQVALEVYGPDSSSPLARWDLASQVLDMEEDREGNIWVATRTRGLLRISPNPVAQLGREQGVELPSSLMTRPDGSAVLRTQILSPDPDQPIARGSVRISPNTLRLEKDPDLYVLTDRLGSRWDYAMEFPDGTRRDGSRTSLAQRCFAIYTDPLQDDRLWTFWRHSLVRFRSFPDRDPVIEVEWPMRAQTEPLFDPDGSLWIGSVSGLQRVQDDQLRTYDRDDGLPVNDVRALHRDAQGRLWIGTYGGGLVQFDGMRFHSIDQRHGLLDDTISSIVADRFGALWLGGNRGIQRVLLRDLDALLDGRENRLPATLFDGADGLDNPEATGAYSGVAVGDHLYFSTFGGLVRVDPARVAEREAAPPRVYLLDAGGEVLKPAEAGLSLSGAQREFSLAFTALHLSAPRTLRFRYRLDGHDADWVDAGEQRTLRYARMPPGDYRLLLQARHSGGPWVDAAFQPSIAALPLWWETRAAQILAVLGVLLLLLASWRLGNRQMRRRAEALEAVVAERTAALQVERDQVARQAGRLQELAEGRARFMSGISHELRTPLSLILAPLADLGEGRHGALPAPALAQLSGAHRNAQRLLRLVERLLEVARVEAGVQTLHCAKTDLRAALAELVEQLLPLAEQRGSTLEVILPDQPVVAFVDLLLMESVLLNLIVNALRHTPTGSRVMVELDAPGSEYDAPIHLRVRDNGPGIPADALPHLFERFFRARGEQGTGAEGFGLGLPLVREVVERHGGRVEVESSSAGTCFHVQLRSGHVHLAEQGHAGEAVPARRQASMLSALASIDPSPELECAPEDNVQQASANHSPGERKQVLIVDDNAELRRLLRSYLEGEFSIAEAEHGGTALERVRESLPDLIISDLMMPVMDGHQLCQALRADPETDFIPLLILTAKAGLDHRIEGLDRGADAYLAKPFDRRELLATVHAMLRAQLRLRDHYLAKSHAAGDAGGSAPEVVHPAPAEEEGTALPGRTEQLRARFDALIEEHLADEDFRIEQLAEGMAQSRSTLHRWCKDHLGQSPGDALRSARLERAKRLLQRGEGSVTEVAYAVGYRSIAHFSTAFRQATGLSPTVFRQSTRTDSATGAS